MAFQYSVISETIGRIGHYILETPQPILEAIKRAGFDAVDLPGNPPKLDVDKFRRLLDSTGLEVNEILGAWAYHHAGESRDLAGDDVEARQRGIDYGKACVDLASALGAKYYQICASQTPVPQIPFPKLPMHVLRSNFLEGAREICEYAGERDITVLFEPLNRYEAYSGILTSVFDAISLIDDLGLPNLGVQPDIYHMNISEGLDHQRPPGGGRPDQGHARERDQSLLPGRGPRRLSGHLEHPEGDRFRRIPLHLHGPGAPGNLLSGRRQRRGGETRPPGGSGKTDQFSEGS